MTGAFRALTDAAHELTTQFRDVFIRFGRLTTQISEVVRPAREVTEANGQVS